MSKTMVFSLNIKSEKWKLSNTERLNFKLKENKIWGQKKFSFLLNYIVCFQIKWIINADYMNNYNETENDNEK